jgi:hypothetical protein
MEKLLEKESDELCLVLTAPQLTFLFTGNG